MVELLAPARDLDTAARAIEAGADALYAGVTNFSMRPKRAELREEGLPALVDYAHALGKRVYVVMNIYPKSAEVEDFKREVELVYEAQADAVVVSDPGLIRFIHRHFRDLPIHVSVMTSVVNPEAALFYKELGASMVVVSRSLDSDEEIVRIRDLAGMDLEVFIHGGICFMFDGICYMSSYWRQDWAFDADFGGMRLFGQNNTKGECQLICKYDCRLVDEENRLAAAGKLMRRPDQVGLAKLPFYMQLGVKVFKIEGRAMPADYIEEATRLYRTAIDRYIEDPDRYRLADEWLPVVDRLLEARLDYERQWHIK